METKVFGDPITDETLKALPEYANKEITSQLRAQVALNVKENVLKLAEQYLEEIKSGFGPGPVVVNVNTYGLIYNSTGNTLNYAYDHNWSGHIYNSYPLKIENGQCGIFRHIGEFPKDIVDAPKQSVAAVVYYANNGLIGGFCKWVLAWYNVWSVDENKVFTEFQAPQLVEQNWGAIREKLYDSSQEQTHHGYGFKATVLIGNGNTPIFIGIITLDLSPPNA